MQQSHSSTLMNSLHQETEPLHLQLEKLPFFTALSSGALPFASYVNQLRSFATIFGTLEYETAAIHMPTLHVILNAEESRFSHLLSDLEYFGDKMVSKNFNAKRHADAMAAKIRLVALEDPVALLGYVYVLKGTTLGNQVHLPDVQRTFNLSGTSGAAFYAGYGHRTDELWSVFCSLMNSFDLEVGVTGRIVAAAYEAFVFLENIHRALFPCTSDDSSQITSSILNPEAGNHAVPSDEREITAALTAGRLCREEFPYFDARYGERGKRFTDSDAAWLATLPGLTPPQIIAQVGWLGGVLSSRGMPRITLERQLFYLHAELIAAVPDKRDCYDKLLAAISWLTEERLRHFPAETFNSLCTAFSTRTDRETLETMKGTGALLVSAVCDEIAGIPLAVQSIEAWLTDVDRFSAIWCAAVRETIAQARSTAK